MHAKQPLMSMWVLGTDWWQDTPVTEMNFPLEQNEEDLSQSAEFSATADIPQGLSERCPSWVVESKLGGKQWGRSGQPQNQFGLR